MDFAYFPTLFIHSWQQVQNVVCNFEKFWERSRSQKYGTVVENLRLEMELENIAEFYKKIFEKKGKKKKMMMIYRIQSNFIISTIFVIS